MYYISPAEIIQIITFYAGFAVGCLFGNSVAYELLLDTFFFPFIQLLCAPAVTLYFFPCDITTKLFFESGSKENICIHLCGSCCRVDLARCEPDGWIQTFTYTSGCVFVLRSFRSNNYIEYTYNSTYTRLLAAHLISYSVGSVFGEKMIYMLLYKNLHKNPIRHNA